jgi:trehalose/maltose hydrolase-like predicted phosphorylase
LQDVTFSYEDFDPESEGLREALTSTGNGYFCTRGTAEWEDAGTVHYPGLEVCTNCVPGPTSSRHRRADKRQKIPC